MLSGHHCVFPALCEKVSKLAPTSTAHHSTAVLYAPPLLQQSKFVFVWCDTHHSPLQCIYKGPFKVITPGTKTFWLDISGHSEMISVDHLKPAHLGLVHPVTLAVPCLQGQPCKLPLLPGSDVPHTAGSSGGYVAESYRPSV